MLDTRVPLTIFRRPHLTSSPCSFLITLNFRAWLRPSSWHNNMRRSLANRCVPFNLQLTWNQRRINAGIWRTHWFTAREIILSPLTLHGSLKSKYSPVMSFVVWRLSLNVLSDARVPSARLRSCFTLCTRGRLFTVFVEAGRERLTGACSI